MSLNMDQLNEAFKELNALNKRVNKLFLKLSLPLKDKVQMDHYGRAYLFGVKVNKFLTNDDLTNIIQSTPEKSWNGHIDFFGNYYD